MSLVCWPGALSRARRERQLASSLVDRYYDPQTGQFISVDPLVEETGLPYAYVGDDPVDSVDPMGLCQFENNPSPMAYLYPGPCATNGKEVLAKEAEIRAEYSSGGLLGGLRSVANFGAGIGNFFASTATLGHVHVSAPYCGYGFGTDLGEWYGAGATALLSLGDLAGAETEVPQVLANQAAGNAARDAIAARYPGALIEQTLNTALGLRRVDVLTSDGLAIESKVGYTSLTESIQTQIAKDQWLLGNGDISAARWEFSPSAVTGQVGPSGPLAEALDKAGISWGIGS